MARSSGPGARAEGHFLEAIARASTLDEAWRVVLSGPKPPAVGAERYLRLGEFLKHLAAPPATTKTEREAYIALLQRFLRTEAVERTVAVRAIHALRDGGRA